MTVSSEGSGSRIEKQSEMVFALKGENNQILYFVVTTTGLRNAHAAKRLVETTEVMWLMVHSLPVCTYCYKVRFGFRANISPLLFNKMFFQVILLTALKQTCIPCVFDQGMAEIGC